MSPAGALAASWALSVSTGGSLESFLCGDVQFAGDTVQRRQLLDLPAKLAQLIVALKS